MYVLLRRWWSGFLKQRNVRLLRSHWIIDTVPYIAVHLLISLSLQTKWNLFGLPKLKIFYPIVIGIVIVVCDSIELNRDLLAVISRFIKFRKDILSLIAVRTIKTSCYDRYPFNHCYIQGWRASIYLVSSSFCNFVIFDHTYRIFAFLIVVRKRWFT